MLFVLVEEIKAQVDSTDYKYWMTWGFMINKDISGNLNYTFSLGDNFFKVNSFGRGSILGGPGENGFRYNSVDVSIGKRFQSEWFQATIFSGPAFVFGEQRQEHGNNNHFNTVGIQSDLQLLFRLANEVGIGIGLYSNLNFKSSFWGFNINITIGNGK